MNTKKKNKLNFMVLCIAFFSMILIPSKALASNNNDYVIQDGVLKEYKGSEADIVIPEGVTSIDVNAFGNSDEDMQFIKSITIPSSLTTLDNGFGFAYCYNALWCPNLQNIYVNANNPSFSSVDGILYDKNQTTLIRYPRGRNKMASIPDTVKSIYKGAFSMCYIKDFKFPSSINQIGTGGFAYLNEVNDYNGKSKSDLLSIVIPNSVNQIADSAFYGAGLKNIVLPQKITSLPDYIFADCQNLSTVTIPKTVKKIGYGAFQGTAAKTATIKGYKNSYAQKYAKKNNIKFIAVTNTDYGSLLKKAKATSKLVINRKKSSSIKVTLPKDLSSKDVTITYKSSNTKIVTVSKKGKVTAKNKKGTTNITVTLKDVYGNKKTITTKITVK
jgi:hypothetical protein